MTADVRNVLAVPASRLRAFTSSPALTAAYLGNVRRAPRFAGSPRLRRRRPAACPPVVLRLHRPRLQSPLSASCPPRTLRPSSRWTRVPFCCTPSPAARPSSPAAPAAATPVARTGRSTARTHTHTHTLSHAHTQSHTHAPTRARARARTRTHAHRALHLRYAYLTSPMRSAPHPPLPYLCRSTSGSGR